MPGPISIHLVKLEQLKSLAAGSTQVDGYRVEPGSLPENLAGFVESLRAGHNPLWASMFLFVDEFERSVVGTGNLHGPPVDGRVEIGYEVAPTHRNKGVCTAAVQLMVSELLKEPAIREVFAESEVGNIPSRRVLEKAGFQLLGQNVIPDYGLVDQWLIQKPTS